MFNYNFNFGRKRALGIDIGTSALKVIELELRNDKPFLSNYGWMSLTNIPEMTNIEKETDFFKITISQYLRKIIKEAGLKGSEGLVAIPAFSGLVTLIEFPQIPPEDMKQAISFEAHKYIPTSLDEVVISWEVIEDSKAAEKNRMQVLLVAASKKKIVAYEKAVKAAGVKLKGVEIENISLVESLVGSDSGNFIIVDIGFYACNIIYVEGGVIKINRNIDIGGDHITKAIAKSLGITKERAEKMKLSGGNRLAPNPIRKFSSLDIILGEVSRIVEILPKKESAPHIDALILSGGTAGLFGLGEFFQKNTGIKTIIGNPFSRVGYDKKMEKIIDSIKGQFAVCIGLALKGIKEKNK